MKIGNIVLVLCVLLAPLYGSAEVASVQHVVISEVQITGGSGKSTDEFIELYNPTDNTISMNSWQLIKKTASGSEYILVDNFEERSILAHSFFLIVHPVGYLAEVQPDHYYTTTNSVAGNNTVILIDDAGEPVDTVGFGSASFFESAAAPNPGSNKSIERKARHDSTDETMIEGGAHYFLGNGEDTENNSTDFVTRSDPEPQNAQTDIEYLEIEVPELPVIDPEEEEDVSEEEITNEIYSNEIIITELFPNPEGKDDGEFIELYNGGDTAVDLESWQLGDESSRRYTISVEILESGQYLAIEKEASGISLNNTSDSAMLYWPDGTLLDSVSYSGCEEARSYSLVNSEWLWSDEVTPGSENQFTIINESPIAVFELEDAEVKVGEVLMLDATDSTDADGDALEYYWDFGNGDQAEGKKVEYAFTGTGTFTITLLAKDSNGGTGEEELEVEVTDYDYSDTILLSELLPSCSPSDRECEFIELFNGGVEDVLLEGWQLTDMKIYYRFGADSVIEAENYLIIERTESKITLNNSEDTVFLLDPSGAIMHGVEYAKAKKDESFSFNDIEKKWLWTSTVTPGSENVFQDEEVEGGREVGSTTAQSGEDEIENSGPVDVAIADVSESLLKKLIRVRGEVESAKSTGIYLMDEFGNTVRIYIQKKTGIAQPDVEPGDTMEVVGILDKTSAGLRILPRTEEDITITKAAPKGSQQDSGRVLGDSVEEEEVVSVPIRDTSKQVRMYLYIVASVCVVVIVFVIVRKKLEKKRNTSNSPISK